MKQKLFTRYEVFIIAILTILQFTIILDFMVLSPLGVILMPTLKITTAQFSVVVSAYAISAGVAGLLTAGFADKFDRKKLLLFFYTGFIIGTLLCGIATTYNFLLMARIVTGLFGGVISSIGFAIIADLFRMEVRGRVMGFVQMAFASSQVLGVPIGFYMSYKWDWHFPFLLIVGISVIAYILVIVYMKPINAHLRLKSDKNAFQHIGKAFSKSNYLKAFAATTLLATGGFMLMPFGSAFSTHNLGLNNDQVTLLYVITGLFSMGTGPFVGKLSDSIGKYTIFFWGTMLSIAVVIFYVNLGITPFYVVTIVSILMFTGVSSRIIASSALMTAVPEPADRGVFMSINSSVQQISGGIAAFIAGQIVVERIDKSLDRYDLLGYTVVGTMLISALLMYFIHLQVERKTKEVKNNPSAPVTSAAAAEGASVH
ncbi:MAG TPA: MFS transporter [Ohtaekwangia sp.]|uniref:MFS transporter n=1 Tax=Ohtaekwangia sp. TaxID=2066019 RepID=UPI002F9311DE